jgi:hypothetical protein
MDVSPAMHPLRQGRVSLPSESGNPDEPGPKGHGRACEMSSWTVEHASVMHLQVGWQPSAHGKVGEPGACNGVVALALAHVRRWRGR